MKRCACTKKGDRNYCLPTQGTVSSQSPGLLAFVVFVIFVIFVIFPMACATTYVPARQSPPAKGDSRHPTGQDTVVSMDWS
jgi:hypothetical protein